MGSCDNEGQVFSATKLAFLSGFIANARRKYIKPDYACRRVISYLSDPGEVPGSSTTRLSRNLVPYIGRYFVGKMVALYEKVKRPPARNGRFRGVFD